MEIEPPVTNTCDFHPLEINPRNAEDQAERIHCLMNFGQVRSDDVYALLAALPIEQLQRLASIFDFTLNPERTRRQQADDLAAHVCAEDADHAVLEGVRDQADFIELIDPSNKPDRWLRVAEIRFWQNMANPQVRDAFARRVGARRRSELRQIEFTSDFSLAIFDGREIPIRSGHERTVLKALAQARGNCMTAANLQEKLHGGKGARLQVEKLFCQTKNKKQMPSPAFSLVTKSGSDGWKLTAPCLVLVKA